MGAFFGRGRKGPQILTRVGPSAGDRAQASQSLLATLARSVRKFTAMIYKFKCKAAGDVIMLGPNGDQMLRLLGRDPAPKGIIEAAAMPAALVALQAAMDAEQARAAEASEGEQAGDQAAAAHAVALRQRLWPMMEMLRRAQAADVPVVWGV